MVTVFFGPNRLILVKATQGWYWAAMLGSVVVGASFAIQFYSGPVILCIYHKVPFGAGFAERSQELL